MMPRTLLARTFLLLALLVILTTAAWLSLFRYIDAEPRARESAQLAASAVNLIRASLFAAAPEKRPGLFNELLTREGLHLLPAESHDQIEPMPETRFLNLLKRELESRLGSHTRVAASVDGVAGFWVSFRLDENDNEEYWLILPAKIASRSIASHWLSWGFLALLLALGMAWLIASRLSRPLKALVQSAEIVGRGQFPAPIPEHGPEELRRLARSFNTMASDLQGHEKDRSEVLAGISHDLRTPLTRLRLEAEMSIENEASRLAAIADIEQMEAVISQFMDYARTESGETPDLVDLESLLKDIAQRRNQLGQTCDTQLSSMPDILLRRGAITRAVNNLLDNAWKYGGGAMTLSSVIPREDFLRGAANQEIWIEIKDHGPGIPADQVERLKRPFTRLESARTDASGTGLGLAIVERVARLHGGRLELLANPEGGLIARLVLPLSD
jgi:two-component system osmolarity sensor histidine kinase EnvZ